VDYLDADPIPVLELPDRLTPIQQQQQQQQLAMESMQNAFLEAAQVPTENQQHLSQNQLNILHLYR